MEDEYMGHWTTLRSTIDLLLVNPENLTSPTHKISFEETYSAVYGCVCSHKAEQLYCDLTNYIKAVLIGWRADRLGPTIEDAVNTQTSWEGPQILDACGQVKQRSPPRISASSIQAVKNLEEVTSVFMRAVPVVVPIFAYLDRFHVSMKLDTSLKAVLLELYDSLIVSPSAEIILDTMEASRATPFSIPPHVMTSIVHNLHKISPRFSKSRPGLFSAYLTGITPPMTEADLAAQRLADAALQQQLRMSGFASDSGIASDLDQSRKRSADLLEED